MCRSWCCPHVGLHQFIYILDDPLRPWRKGRKRDLLRHWRKCRKRDSILAISLCVLHVYCCPWLSCHYKSIPLGCTLGFVGFSRCAHRRNFFTGVYFVSHIVLCPLVPCLVFYPCCRLEARSNLFSSHSCSWQSQGICCKIIDLSRYLIHNIVR